ERSLLTLLGRGGGVSLWNRASWRGNEAGIRDTGGSCGVSARTENHAADLSAAAALLLHSLFHLLSRPREHRLRSADDEPGSGAEQLCVWHRRRCLLLGLFHPGGAKQPDLGESR